MKKILTITALLIATAVCRGQPTGNCSNQTSQQTQRSCADSQKTAVSGTVLTIQNNGGLVPAFEELITGVPATVSIVIQGCGPSGTCDTLDTYTTVANSVRAPTISKFYSYYTVTPSWTGGTNPVVTVNTTITSARLNGGNSGSGISGATAGQALIAGSATTATSSKALAGSGAGITTGPTSSTNTDCANFSGTGGQIADSGAPCGTGGGISPLPAINNLFVVGASQDIGFNTQQEGFISSQTPGTGYSGTGTAAVGSLTCATGGGARQPVVNAVTVPGGTGLTYSVSDFGQGCTPGTYTITPSGFTGGSGSSAVFTVYSTPNYPTNWPAIIQTLSALNGKITTFNNYSITAHTVAQAISDITTNGYLTKCGATGNNYVIVGGDLLRNSIASLNGNIPLATAYAQWVGFTHVLKANGCILIVTTPWDNLNLGGGGGGNGGATNAQAAQLIRNGVKGVDYDLLIDFGAMVLNASDPTLVAWDQLHPTQSGQYMFAYVANQALLTGNPGTLGNLPNQLVGTTLSVSGNATIGAGSGANGGNLAVTGYAGTTPLVAGLNMTFLGTSFNDSLFYSASTTSTPGIFDFKGFTVGNTPTQYLQLASTGSTFSVPVIVGGKLSTNGSGAIESGLGLELDGFTAPASGHVGLGITGNFTYLQSRSTTTTAGGIVLRGITTGNANTDYATISPTSASWIVPIIQGQTKFTATGCTSITSTLGNGTAGSFVIGAASCTVAITLNGVTGMTAANGWDCHATDQTTSAANATLEFLSSTTTTATLTVPVTATANDLITFSCRPY